MILLISTPGGAELLVFALALALIIAFIAYLMTLFRITNTISLENRNISPGQIWFLLIPLFNLVWHFVVVKRIAGSITAESISSNIQIKGQQATYKTGLAMCAFGCLSVLPVIGEYAGIAYFVCWIIYWSKLAAVQRLLVQNKGIYAGKNDLGSI